MPAVKGREIRQRRQRLGLKAWELAEKARVATQTLYNIETAGQTASIEVVYRLAGVLGVEAQELLADDGSNGDRAA